MKTLTEKFNRLFDATIVEIAERLEIDPNTLLIFLTILWAVFAVAFSFGYELSNQHFLHQINLHQIENGLPTFDRTWLKSYI